MPFILAWHRVTDGLLDPFALNVTPAHFEQQLDLLHNRCTVVPLEYLLKQSASGDLPENAVALTFDDGYADNLANAKPVLDSFDLPATFFLCVNAIRDQEEFWWDELVRLVLSPEQPAKRFRLAVPEGAIEVDLGSPYRSFDQLRSFRARKRAETQRHTVVKELCALMRALDPVARTSAMKQLRENLAPVSAVGCTYQPLTEQEARRLFNGEKMTPGAHSLTHSFLPALSREAQVTEIVGSKQGCEELLGRPVSYFAYPYGEHNGETEALVAQAGYRAAVTTEARRLEVGSSGMNRYTLPRICVHDCDGPGFAQLLDNIRSNAQQAPPKTSRSARLGRMIRDRLRAISRL